MRNTGNRTQEHKVGGLIELSGLRVVSGRHPCKSWLCWYINLPDPKDTPFLSEFVQDSVGNANRG